MMDSKVPSGMYSARCKGGTAPRDQGRENDPFVGGLA